MEEPSQYDRVRLRHRRTSLLMGKAAEEQEETVAEYSRTRVKLHRLEELRRRSKMEELVNLLEK